MPGAGDDAVISQTGITVTHGANISESVNSLTSQANVDWQNGSLTAAGQVFFAGGTVTIAGAYAAGSTTTHASVSLTGVVENLGALAVAGTLDLSRATLAPAALTLPSLTLGTPQGSHGTLITAASFTVAGPFLWSIEGMLTGGGSLTANGGMTINNVGYDDTLDNFTITNNGYAAWISGNVHTNNGAVFNNSATGTFDVQSSSGGQLGASQFSGPHPAFHNAGLVKKSGSGNDALGLPFDGAGAIEVDVGELDVGSGNGYHNNNNTYGGTITGAAGTFLEFDGGVSTFTNAAGIQTAGTLQISGGTFSFAGPAPVRADQAQLYSSGTIAGDYAAATSTSTHATVSLAGPVENLGALAVAGTLDLSQATLAPAALTLPSLTLGTPQGSHGTLITAASFTVAGPFLWSIEGMLTGGGSLTANGGMTINNVGYDDTLDNFTVTNTGYAAWMSGTVRSYGSASSFTNAAGATFDDQTDGTFGSFDANCMPFYNYGLFIKSGGDGTTTLQAELVNGGDVQVKRGNLRVTCGYVQPAGSSGSATGAIDATVINSGEIQVAPSPNPPLVVTGFTQSISGILTEVIGGYTPGTQYGQIVVNGDVNLDGTLRVQLINSFTPHLGDPFTIIDNRGSNSVGGAFTGVPEGATVWDATHTYGFAVSYQGGDGNDVVLTVATIIPPASLSGVVFVDFNDDGQVDFGEKGIAGVAIALTGTDDLGHAVDLQQLTDSDGFYAFLNLRPGSYTLTETQPAGYGEGISTLGTAGGTQALDQFFVALGAGVDGMNYNYGERPPASGAVQKGQTANIAFWNNKNGQALIKAFNGGTGHELADWLAATLPNIFGVHAGSNNLTGKSNADVAAFFQQEFLLKGIKLDAQVLATALSVYATNATLDSTAVAAQYGFTVSGYGLGTATVNVRNSGAAFGVADNTVMTVMDLLLATNSQAVNGVLYSGNTAKRTAANSVYSAVNG